MTVVRHLIIQETDPAPHLVKAWHSEQKKKSTVKPIARSLNEWGDAWLQAMGSLRGHQTLKNYGVMLAHLADYQTDHKRLKPEQLTNTWNESFLQWLIDARQLRENSVGAVNKNLRQFCKWLSKQGGVQVPADWQDFRVYASPPQIFFLEIQELEQFYHHDFGQYTGMARARDLFCFQARTGQRISDLKRTRDFMIMNNMIHMRAHKNRKDIVIPFNPMSREIWERYDGQLPFKSDQRYNRALKDALRTAGIDRTVELVTYRGKDKIYEHVPLWQVITNHDAIKTYCTNGIELGMSVLDLVTITGKTKRTLENRYIGKSTEQSAFESAKRAFGN